jgi:hypothetical protein
VTTDRRDQARINREFKAKRDLAVKAACGHEVRFDKRPSSVLRKFYETQGCSACQMADQSRVRSLTGQAEDPFEGL